LKYLVEFKNISKSFPGVQALKNVTFGVVKGSVHCLIGENGAGKSTLIKILSGAYQMDSGEIIIDGKRAIIDNPRRAIKHGISFIYQEQNLIPQLSVEDNITLGTEDSAFGVLRKQNNTEVAKRILDRLSLGLDLKKRLGDLSYADRQMVAIAKALHLESTLIVMDEASGALTVNEQDKLFGIIKGLKSHGVTIIYISHNLDDIYRIGDYVTVLRDGEYIDTLEVEKINRDGLIKMMVGKTLSESFTHKDHRAGECILSLRNVTLKGVLKKISIDVYGGEIIGIYGLVGSGRTELARVIFGADTFEEGEIRILNKTMKFKSPKKALRKGIALVPEDRRQQGLIGLLSVKSNISLPSAHGISRLGVIQNKEETKLAKKYVGWLNIKTPTIDQQVQYLSGGNQQKVVISKMLTTDPKILLMDEPTRGIDVGAKAEIFRIMKELADLGAGIIMFSSELQEVLKVSDRIFIMYKGSIIKELSPSEATKDKILHYATGGGD
jgi:ABC-type sugar transport system ATPase subunit